MEWYVILLILILIILAVGLGVILACIFAGQHCTVSIQQRQPNHELTQIQQEQERKKQKKMSSKLKRTFGSSKTQQPLAPVEDVKTVKFTLKLGDNRKQSEELKTTNESAMVFLPKAARASQAELDAAKKQRDDIRRKYNL